MATMVGAGQRIIFQKRNLPLDLAPCIPSKVAFFLFFVSKILISVLCSPPPPHNLPNTTTELHIFLLQAALTKPEFKSGQATKLILNVSNLSSHCWPGAPQCISTVQMTTGYAWHLFITISRLEWGCHSHKQQNINSGLKEPGLCSFCISPVMSS